MTRRVAVIGAAASPNGRLQMPPDAPLQTLEHEVLAPLVIEAMAIAGVPKEEVGALVFAMCRPYTLQKYFATFMANYLRLPLKGSIMEVLGNGMTGGMAFDQAINAVALGHADVALALGINMESQAASAEHAMSTMRATGDVDFHTIFGFTPIAWYAMDAVRYMHDFGAARTQLASVAVKNRRHARLNPIAQFRKPLSLQEVLAARPIVEPLGLFEVPPRGDGAVCLVVCAEELAKATGNPYALVRGRGFFHDGTHQLSDVPNDMIAFSAAQRAAAAAYSAAGIGPGDLDLAELYAPCTIVEVLAGEALGLTPRGRGAAEAQAGETSLGGRIPICTSGGCLSRGHPAYVTGLLTIYELWEQLTHRAGERQVADARLAAGSCELGNYNAALIHILEAVA
jgi:acetyl-CoA C-acetyltransferase